MRRKSWTPYAVIAVFAGALHLPTLAFDFVFDDDHLIVNNNFLKEPWSPLRAFAHHFWHGTAYGTGYYRPIVAASLALNGRLLGWGPAGFHLVNVLLHALNAVLLLALARRLALPVWAAVLGAALFAVHPVAAWPVASIVARVDLLPASFVLLAWLSYTSCARDRPASQPGRTLGRAALTGLFFLLALLSKESAVAFLAVPVMGLRRMRDDPNDTGEPEGRRAAWYGLGAAVLALLIYAGARTLLGIGISISIDPTTNPLAFLPLPGRIYAALRLTGRYLLYLLVPLRFADPTDYGREWRALSPVDFGVVLSALLLLSWIVATLLLWRRRRRISIPLAFALGSFLPASNLLRPIASLYAVNFLYMPLVGVCLAAGELLARFIPAGEDTTVRILRSPKMIVRGAVPVLALLAFGSVLDASIWRDRVTLFSDWVHRFPRYSLAHSCLGESLLTRGKTGAALNEFRKALEIDDRNVGAHFNLGAALVYSSNDQESLTEALVHSRRAAELNPKLVPARTNAGKILLLLHRPAEAEIEAREALRLIPDDFAARRTLAESLFQQDRYREAAVEFKTLARIDGSDTDVRSPYVVSLLKSGDLAEARSEAEAARHDFPDLAWFDFCLARVEARSSHRVEALALLRNALAKDRATREWIAKVPDFDSYRGTAEFDELLTGALGGTAPAGEKENIR